MLGCTAVLAGCAVPRSSPAPAAQNSAASHELIERALPPAVPDRAGWTADMYAGFTALAIAPTRANICAVVAVIEQESGFRVDPVIPGLPTIAWREIDARAARAGIPRLLVHGVLQLKSATGRSYGERIDSATTERQLSDIYEDFIGAVPMGRTLFADRNPIRTRGPMQVQVAFAEQYAAVKPYPYPVNAGIAAELFTRRGGVYFGIAHLLAYPAPYDRYLFRFADFNAGQYASRNAAFQNALSRVSRVPLVDDGALLPHDGDGAAVGATELAARSVAARLDLDAAAIHRALEQAKTSEFEQSTLYQRAFATAEKLAARPLPRAMLPQIELHSPKFTRKLTTQWYAKRVEERFNRCLER